MQVFSQVKKRQYTDSLEALFRTMVLSEQSGVAAAYVGMGHERTKQIVGDLGLMTEEIRACGEDDMVIVAKAETQDAFAAAIINMEKESRSVSPARKRAYATMDAARKENPNANICVLSIPGESVKREAMRALDAGMHLLIFSSHVPMAEEREIKLYAERKGLLCMGPDCGVVNLNGAAFVLGSVTRRGPVGICGASGIGVQYVGAMLHKAGSGVSQIIGTGGNDTKDAVGGITTLMGLEALDRDPETRVIVLISRKPGEETFPKIMARVEQCAKPVVVYYMGTKPGEITRHKAVWAGNLEDAARRTLELVGKRLDFDREEDLRAAAAQAVKGMDKRQKYVRGAFLGGTYCDEAIRTLTELIGPVQSNAPITPETRLENAEVSVKHTVIDYGEEEFTKGRPHPTIEPGVRLPAVLREAEDPETAVLLLDFVLTPAGPKDPVAPVIREIRKARELVRGRGGELAVVASVCGTNADIQNLDAQEKALRDAGVHVCMSNYKAALLAGEIVRQKKAVDAHER